jgi:hypothetical protein
MRFIPALDTAREPFEQINRLISAQSGTKFSDKPFNRAVAKALKDTLDRHGFSELEIRSEARHPWLNIIPDIMVTTADRRNICIEFYYTTNHQPNRLAQYCLNKLHTYMKQVEEIHKVGQLPLFRG